MEFDKSFFESETREDFLIDSNMKHNWAAQIEMFVWLMELCKENRLRIFADFGTLLGAVRHRGFIPWDDDIDLCMMREDYEVLMELLRQKADCCYLMVNEFMGDYMVPFAHVSNSCDIRFDDEYLEKYHGWPFFVGIDIFPIDNMSNDLAEEKTRREIMLALKVFMQLVYKKNPGVEEMIPQIEHLTGYQFDRNQDLVEQSYNLYTTLSTIYNGENTKFVGTVAYSVQKITAFPCEAFDDILYMDFENIKMPVPVGYDQILRARYGDYMTPVKSTASHDYPFYANQIRIADEHGLDWQSIISEYMRKKYDSQ